VNDRGGNAMHEPYQVVLEFVRTSEAQDPYAFRYVERAYLRRIEDSPPKQALFSWDDIATLDAIDDLARQRPSEGAAFELGKKLDEFLNEAGFAQERQGILRALLEGRRVDITLWSAAAELYVLPWEMTALADGRLGDNARVLLRYEWFDRGKEDTNANEAPPKVNPPPEPEGGQILVAWSAAGGAVPARDHIQAIEAACRDGFYPPETHLDVLPRVSLEALREKVEDLLRSSRKPAILHVLCHGTPDGGGSTQGLVWDDSSGDDDKASVVSAEDLCRLLTPYASSLRLVVLCACHAGSPGRLSDMMKSRLPGIAQALQRAGVRAVIAPRFALSDRGSVVFTRALYRSLLVDLRSLEDAFLEARAALRAEAGVIPMQRGGLPAHGAPPEGSPRKAEGALDWAAMQLYARRKDGWDHRPVVFRPYRGLLTFQPEHARFFFGRDAERDALVSAIMNDEPFRVVAGASGSGKSSLVLAGVIPALERLTDPPWNCVVMRPGDSPMSALLVKLRAHAGDGAPTPQEITLAVAASAVERLLQKRPGTRCLLVVDQFEELFTHVAAPKHREEFAQTLWRLTNDFPGRFSVLLTMRVDFFARCGEIALDKERRLDAVVYEERYRTFVSGIQPQQLCKIVTGPARRVGLTLQPGLEQRLLRDAGDEPGALPLLEYTLDLLWQSGSGRELTDAAYDAMGTLDGALTKTASDIFNALDPKEKIEARRLFLELVEVGRDGELQTRRRMRLADLLPPDPSERAAMKSALLKLTTARLVVQGTEDLGADGESAWVTVAHEALIRRWETLQAWMRADYGLLQGIRRLESWWDDWRGRKGGLLTGDRLGYAKELRDAAAHLMRASLRAFILQSDWAEWEARSAARHRVRIALAIVVGVAISIGLLGLWGRAEAIRARDAARLAAVRGLLVSDPTTARLVLLEVEQPESVRGFTQEVLNALETPVVTAIVEPQRPSDSCANCGDHFDSPSAVSPDGSRAVMQFEDGTVRLVALRGVSGRAESTPLAEGRLSASTFSRDGSRAAVALENGRVILLRDAPMDAVEVAPPELSARPSAIAISPDGLRVAVGRADGAVHLWVEGNAGLSTIEGPAPLGNGDPASRSIHSFAFSPGGDRLVALTDGLPRVYDLESGGRPTALGDKSDHSKAAAFYNEEYLITLGGEELTWWSVGDEGFSDAGTTALSSGSGAVVQAYMSDDGRWISTMTTTGEMTLFKIDFTQRPAIALKQQNGHDFSTSIGAVKLSSYGSRALILKQNGVAEVWSLEPENRTPEPRSYPSPPRHFFINSRGESLVETDGFTIERAWSVAGDGSLRATTPPRGAKDLNELYSRPSATEPAFEWSNSSGRWKLIKDDDGLIRVFHALDRGSDLEPARRIPELRGEIHALDEEANLVLFGREEEFSVASLDSGHITILEGDVVFPSHAAFSPDGSRLAMFGGGIPGSPLLVWDLRTRRSSPIEVALPSGHSACDLMFDRNGSRLLISSFHVEAHVPHVRIARLATPLAVWEVVSLSLTPAQLGIGTDCIPVAMSAGGERAMVAGADFRSWPLSTQAQVSALRRSISICLPPSKRRDVLGESEEDAYAAYARCERAHGRAPPAPATDASITMDAGVDADTAAATSAPLTP
jgi:WD40 repeat protein